MKHITALFTILSVCLTISCSQTDKNAYSWDKDLQHRYAVDFSHTREDVKSYIKRYIPDVTDEQIDSWTESGILESMEIDGQTMYFNRTAPNLFRVDPVCKAIKAAQTEAEPFLGEDNYREVVAEAAKTGNILVAPKHMRIEYSISVDADAVPAGETVRCWLPYPRRDVERQKDVKFISASESNYILADAAEPHSSLYMEKKAVAGEPTVFTETFEYVAYADRFMLSEENVLPYDEDSDIYKEFTRERNPHMVFSPRMIALSDSLTAGLTNPYAKVKAIFDWIDANFPWAGAREYSTIENIPEYVLDVRHGDCGQQTLLFMTLARIAGIPTHWQSGFQVIPGDDNLHDWCYVYFEGHGWVPLDMSRGIMHSMEEECRYFNLGSMDSYRLIVNNDYGRDFVPAKKYPRSETVDFQRGEVEWAGGNLYFDLWSYDMKIEYLD